MTLLLKKTTASDKRPQDRHRSQERPPSDLYLLKNKYKKRLDKQAYILYNMKARLERYRSGHNEAVLKTVCPKGRVGSNPTLSV